MTKTSGFAIASLILGIFALLIGWIPIFGWLILILAIIFGFIGLQRIKKDVGTKGKGMAIAGIIMGFISLAITILLLLLIFLAGYLIDLSENTVVERTPTIPQTFSWQTASIAVTNIAATSDGSDTVVDITLRNNLPDTIRITNILLTDVYSGYKGSITSPGDIHIGSTNTFSIFIPEMTGISGDFFEFILTLEYLDIRTGEQYTFPEQEQMITGIFT